METRSMLFCAALVTAFVATPLAYSPSRGVAENSACAQVKNPTAGTCCLQEWAVCVTPTGNIYGRYFKSEGMC